jgi:acetyltransferase-like isoleucine patch superfamily enzyme
MTYGKRIVCKGFSKDIEIGNGVWSGSIILPGTNIGKKYIVATQVLLIKM